MDTQDLLTVAVLLSIVLYVLLFGDGGPGTPKRIKIPLPKLNTSW